MLLLNNALKTRGLEPDARVDSDSAFAAAAVVAAVAAAAAATTTSAAAAAAAASFLVPK